MTRRMHLLPLMTLLLICEAGAQGIDSHAAHKGTTFHGHETRVILPDAVLQDSEGRQQMLSSLIGNRVVVLNFVFTSCTTVCPAFSAILRSTEQQLTDRLGKEVILVSISVDPLNDTPAKLRTYANKIGAGAHWYWLTGSQANIEKTMRAFGVPVGGRPEDHPPTILVGKASTGRWLRWIGMASPESLIAGVNISSSEPHSAFVHNE